MPRDYYEILGVSKDASEDDIKSAHRRLSREYHPDRNPGDKQAEERFKEVQQAYEILRDPSKRAQYDRGGFPGMGDGSGGPFRWGTGGSPFEGFDPSEMDLASILRRFAGGGAGEEMGDVFGRRARSQRGRRTQQPVEQVVSIPFLTAARGGKMTLSVGDREVSVTIPPGVAEGKTLRVAGQGPGGADIHLKLRILPHPYFRREGSDIILEVPLTITEATLGHKVEVPTIDDTRLTVTIPPGTPSGARLRLRGKGIKGGNQYIQIKIVPPREIDARGRELLEEFSRLYAQNPRKGTGWS